MQLERRDDIFCGLVQHACLRAVVADPRQLLLDPAYGGQAGALEILCISGRQVGPIPPSYALRGQFSPRKQRAGVDFPLWRDVAVPDNVGGLYLVARSEEHTSELQSLMRISYAVFCLKK